MKRMLAILFSFLLTGTLVRGVQAQAIESIWLTASNTAYKTGETVAVTVNAAAGTAIQGFTFQIRYDPACLKPVNASSPVPGMNGLTLPQISGQVDGSYASTTPQVVNGTLAEVYFQALKGCQTSLNLESAALAVRSPEGFAVPLAGITLQNTAVTLNIDSEAGAAQVNPQTGAYLPLEPTLAAPPKPFRYSWLTGLLAVLLIGGLGFLLATRLSKPAQRVQPTPEKKVLPTSAVAMVHFKRGPHAGQSIALNKLPFLIGRDPSNDLCLNDPHIQAQHVRIFETSNGYYLMDLGGETYVNGQMVKRNSAFLKPGDVVRLGKSALFVFGS